MYGISAAQLSIPYLTEQVDDALRKNILLRLWTGCMDMDKLSDRTSLLERFFSSDK